MPNADPSQVSPFKALFNNQQAGQEPKSKVQPDTSKTVPMPEVSTPEQSIPNNGANQAVKEVPSGTTEAPSGKAESATKKPAGKRGVGRPRKEAVETPVAGKKQNAADDAAPEKKKGILVSFTIPEQRRIKAYCAGKGETMTSVLYDLIMSSLGATFTCADCEDIFITRNDTDGNAVKPSCCPYCGSSKVKRVI